MSRSWGHHLPHLGSSGLAGYRDWLKSPGSLTARLVATCDDFRVEVLFQGLTHLDADEARLFGLPDSRLAWVREVCLLCDDQSCIFARSVLPCLPRRGVDRLFHGLGSRSLGSMLFSSPAFTRGALSFCRHDAHLPLFRRAFAATGENSPLLWARRSLFAQGGKYLLVAEVFLNELMQRPIPLLK